MEAAYGALVSLLNTMDLIHNHPLLSTSLKQFESLNEKVNTLMDFVEHYSHGVEDLVEQIAVAANGAEDIIEAHAADRMRAASTQQSPVFLPDLQKILEDMDSIKGSVIMVKEGTKEPTYSMPPPLPPPLSATSPPIAVGTTSAVGFDGYVARLLDDLTGHEPDRRIIPISGMGGIGKTTLARNLYENSLIQRRFNVRVWITVSQEFSPRKIYLQALSCLGVSSNGRDGHDDKELSLELYKILFNRRYMIVLDDVWTVEAWEKIKFYFPESRNGSRIIVTSRESKVVNCFGSSVLAVDFLDEKNSLKLFYEKTFGREVCPSELEEVGKKILKKCKGLPLAIVVIGGLLRKSPASREYWEEIAKEKSLILESGEGDEPLSLLYLSYKHLPIHLKSCFVYLGLFPEDEYFGVSEIIRLWVAEGFIKPNANQSLEEVAEGYIKDLVDRNLLFLRATGEMRNFYSYGVHDLVRDLCMTTAEKNDLFRVERDERGRRHISVDEKATRFYSDLAPIARPRVFRRQKASPSRVLVRDMCQIDYTSPDINLRVLYHNPSEDAEFLNFDPRDYFHTYDLPSSISLLWSLQALIVNEDSAVAAPSEIWKMPQLRHIEVSSIILPDPLPSDDFFLLHNLHTLENVKNLVFTEEVCKRIPNIKQMDVFYSFQKGEAGLRFRLENVARFDKLERLYYSCLDVEYAGGLSRQLKLPSSLKELTLSGSQLASSDMITISSLPLLQILRLEKNAVVGEEWDCFEEEFVSLKHLHIDRCEDLIKWIAGSLNFPVLETLSLRFLPSMDEIPLGIGEIPTLQRIYMKNCGESANMSAAEILEEQENLGNLILRLQLDFSEESEAETCRVKVEELAFACQNIHIFSSGHSL